MQGHGSFPDPRQDLEAGLDGALGPALLLGLESVHLLGEFCWDDEIRQEEKAPSFQLCAVAKIEILRERVVVPSPRLHDGLPAPDAGGAVEVEESARVAAGGLLKQ